MNEINREIQMCVSNGKRQNKRLDILFVQIPFYYSSLTYAINNFGARNPINADSLKGSLLTI